MGHTVKKLIVTICIAVALAGCGEDKPGKAQIKNGLIDHVPGIYAIGSISIDAQANVGDSVTPAYKTRFSVVLSPKEPLYEQAPPVEGVRLIRLVRKDGESFKLYGVALSNRQGEGWTTLIEFEERFPDGAPRSDFPAGALVQDTAEAKAAINKVLEDRKIAIEQRATKLHRLRDSLVGIWRGQFVCGQSEGGAELTISEMSETGAIRGSHKFFSLPGRKNLLPGEFAVVGSVNIDTNLMTVQPAGWIHQPPGYDSLGYAGQLEANGTAFEGKFPGVTGCTTIALKKQTVESLAAIRASERAVEEQRASKLRHIRDSLIGTWRGQYICNEGEGGSELIITEMSETGSIRGDYKFFSLPGRKNIPPGEYAVVGSVNTDNSVVTVEPAGWIHQPPGYASVGFVGHLETNDTAIEGKLPNLYGCKTISLRKAG
jgi:hypothetical protein